MTDRLVPRSRVGVHELLFTALMLPLDHVSYEPHPPHPAGTEPSHPLTPIVLIAERDQNVRALQAFFLDKAGFVAAFADDGAAALERARLAPPAVIVTEILIPKIDGLTLCRRLRDDPVTRHVPVIVFSILAAAARASDAGARDFLRKPIVESTFVAAVRLAMSAQPSDVMEQQWTTR